jgi:type IV pilus assembly protein PilW
MSQMHSRNRVNEGFTLTELLVAMTISGFVIAAIYSTYYSQQKSYTAQEQVAQMQQNLRGAIYHIGREIRMAGYDPTGGAGARIESAVTDSIRFTKDEDGDGTISGTTEDITFSLGDGDGDGDNDLLVNGNVLAENFDALNFVYLNESGTSTTAIPNVRSVQITLVARSGRRDLGHMDNRIYTNRQGVVILPSQNDDFRRMEITKVINCRNFGI